MRTAKTATVQPPKKRTYTRKVVKKAIVSQEQECGCNQPIEEQIRLKAYELFLARGGVWGDPQQDWIEAEKIILKKIK